MQVKRWEIYLEIIMEMVFMFLIAGLLILGLPKALGFLWPFVVGWLISLFAAPLCNFLEKKLMVSRKWGSVFILVLSIAFVAGVLALLGYVIGNQAMDWARNLPEIYRQSMKQLQLVFEQFFQNHKGVSLLETLVQKLLDSANTGLSSFVSSIGAYGMNHAGNLAKSITNGLIGTIVTLLASYLFICDKEQLALAYNKIMPEFIKDKVSIFCENTLGVLVDYCVVQMKLMGVIAVILFIGFLIMKIKYAVLFAFLISLVDVLPFLGTGIILIPWAIYMALSNRIPICIGFLVLYAICLVLKQVLQPKMLGERMELNSLLTLVLMYGGLKLKGIIGLIYALIFGIFFTNLYKRGAFDTTINRFKMRFTMLYELDQKNK